MSVLVDPTDPTQASGGQPPRPDSDISILRSLMRRVEALETSLSQSGGVRFVSPDGSITKTLSIDNSGTPIWT